jgi:kynureninase
MSLTGAPSRSDAAALDAADPLAGLRDLFEVGQVVGNRDEPIYLDGNSLGRLAHATRARLADAVDEWGRRLIEGWQEWHGLAVDVGDRLAATVLDAGGGQVAVTDSTTVNLYKLADAALAARPGRRVIVGDREDFPTDRYVLEGLAAARGAELRLLDSDAVDGLDPDAVASAVDRDTALVCLSHVNYRSAARADMATIGALAHHQGALMLWDLSHSAGAVPLHLDDDGADLAVGCTYKYLNAGPGAPAFLYVRRELQEELRQPIWGWFGQRDQFAMGQGYDPEPDIRSFLAGTPPVLGLIAVDAGLEPFARAGIDRLWAKSLALTGLLIQLHDAWLAPLGCRLASPRDLGRRGAHVSIGHEEGWRLCRALIERAGVIPDFRAPDVIRLGPAPLYTRFVDVWDACDRLRRLLDSGEYLTVDASRRPVT